MNFTCKQCSVEFRDDTRRVFCSRACKGAYERFLDPIKLAELVSKGMENRHIAAALGVSKPRITRALQTYGLHELWRSKRFERVKREEAQEDIMLLCRPRRSRKPQTIGKSASCINSLLAGWKCPEILGASEVRTDSGQSARSCTPKDGGMNCGI